MEKKVTIYKKPEGQKRYNDAYDATLSLWNVPFETKYVKTSYGKTHMIVCGDEKAPPLILLHGMTISATMWYPNISEFAKHFRVYAIDTIGDLGKTVPSKIVNTKEEVNDWLNEVLEALKIEKAFFAGHSMGGFLTLNFALAYPEKVKRIVLFAPAGTFAKLNSKFFFKIFPAILTGNRFLIKKAYQWFFYKEPADDNYLTNQFMVGYQNCIPQLRVRPSVFSDEELQNLEIPTLVLIGEHEVIYDCEKVIEEIKRKCKIAQTHIIPDASHCLTVEKTDMINSLTIEFLTEK